MTTFAPTVVGVYALFFLSVLTCFFLFLLILNAEVFPLRDILVTMVRRRKFRRHGRLTARSFMLTALSDATTVPFDTLDQYSVTHLFLLYMQSCPYAQLHDEMRTVTGYCPKTHERFIQELFPKGEFSR